MTRRRGPAVIEETIDTGTAQLVPDPDQPGCWTVMIDGAPQSYVDLNDPTHLHFEYVRRFAAVIDTAAPAGSPLRVLHLGGGGLTLPRYVAATRPGSGQRVVECDAGLIAAVRRHLPLPRGLDLRIRAADGREVVEGTAAARHDAVITDVFGGAQVPGRFGTVEFATEVARVLRPGGRYLVNLADAPPLTYARRQAATLRSVFGEVCLFAEAGVLRGRRFGNLVLAAACTPGTLPLAELATRAARDSCPARMVAGADLDRFISGASAVHDHEAHPSPPPPAGLFGRVSR